MHITNQVEGSLKGIGSSLFFVLLLTTFGCNRETAKSEQPPQPAAASNPVEAAANGTPAVTLDKPGIDFKVAQKGAVIHKGVTLTNSGDAPLIIGEIESSCGCTGTLISDKTVAPGKSATIKIEVDTISQMGKFDKYITINTNDPKRRRIIFPVRGTIVADVTATPGSLHFGRVPLGTSKTMPITLTVNDPEKVKLTAVTTTLPELVSITRKDGQPDGSGTFDLTFKGAPKVGTVSAELVVTYTGSPVSELHWPITIEVVTDLAYPTLVYFRRVHGKFLERKITFHSRSGKPVAIKKFEDPKGFFDLKIMAGPKPGESTLVVNVKDNNKKYDTEVEYDILVSTDNEQEPVAKVTCNIGEEAVFAHERWPSLKQQ